MEPAQAIACPLQASRLHGLPTALYVILKTRLSTLLSTLFAIVKVPPEKPGKVDHGDIDFVVACPLRPNSEGVVTPEQVGCVLDALKSIELDGNRTSNYAIEIGREDWIMYTAQPMPSERIYCQVDVKVCDDEEEVERLMVFHGYGDLGIIIGSVAKSHGLSVNHHGLKIACPPDPPMHLSHSPRLILEFMGLSMGRWMDGFDTVEEIFDFAATSRFFDPLRLRGLSMQTFNKSANGRSMYFDFLVWAEKQASTTSTSGPQQDAVGEALVIFDKKSEWDAMAQERHAKAWLKNNFNGKLVAEWTGLGWKGVKAVMDDVRSSVGGDRALVGMELEQVKSLVLISQKSLKLES